MEVTGLYRYPIAGCQEQKISHAYVNQHGMVGDREFIAVPTDGDHRSFQSKTPALARIKPQIDAAKGVLRLSAPGDTSFEDVEAPLEAFTQDPCMVTISKRSDKRVEARGLGGYAAVKEWLGDVLRQPHTLMRITQGNAGFHDGMHLTSQASLEAVEKDLDRDVPMRQFRPNIVIDGHYPFNEHNWSQAQIGMEMYYHDGNTIRCQYVNTDQRSGRHIDDELLTYLATRRQSRFGIMLMHEIRDARNPFAHAIMLGDRVISH